MKKMILMLALCLMAGQASIAQTESNSAGTIFQDNKPLAEALEKAKSEGKLLFVDCYTTWCGPCKMMANNVFPQPSVGAFMNERFVSLKVDMEKGEGPELGQRYQIRAYPTFLVLESDGAERVRMTGSRPAEQFVGMLSELLQAPSISQMNRKWENGERSDAFLRQYYPLLKNAMMSERAQEVANLLVEGKTDALLADSMLAYIFVQNVPDVFSDTYRYVWNNRQLFRQRYGDAFDRQLQNAWELTPYLFISGEGKDAVLDETRMKEYIVLMEQLQVEHREEMGAMAYIYYALISQHWKDFVQRADDYRQRFQIEDGRLRNWAASILNRQNPDDKDLSAAQQWIRDRLAEREKSTEKASDGKKANAVPMIPLKMK